MADEIRTTAWRPISDAPRDKTRIWGVMHQDIYPRLSQDEHRCAAWNGVQISLRHDGKTASGYDMGWSVAAPLGFGGIPDQWIAGWMPLPEAPQ